MAGVWLWVRREWSRRLLGLVGLGLLIALVGGITLAVTGGARRTASAFGRLEERTNQPQVQVDVRQPENPDAATPDGLPTTLELAEQISRVDGVQGVHALSMMGATPDPRSDFFAFASGAERGAAPTSRVLTGRFPRADAPNEVVVNEPAAEQWGVEPSSSLTIYTLGADQMLTFLGLESEEPHGPVIEATVVGVFRDAEGISDLPEPVFVAGPAFLDRWGSEIVNFTGTALVKVDSRRVDETIEALRAAIDPRYVASRVSDNDDFAARVADTIDVEVTVLAIFAVAAAIAGLVVLGQALARAVGGSSDEHASLGALGVTHAQAVVAATATLAPALALGVAGSMLLAIGLSPLFPRGLAHRAEPDPGIRIDAPVLLLGAAALAAVLIAIAAFTSWRAIRRASVVSQEDGRRPGLVARLTGALPPVPALGTRFALERERRRGPIVGSAGVVGAAILVGGLVAVATLDRSREELLTDGHLYGANWDLETDLEGEHPDQILAALVDDPDVAAVSTRAYLPANDGDIPIRGPNGSFEAGPFAPTPLRGSIPPVLSAGRPPGPRETIIGRQLAGRLGASIGDTIVAEGFSGDVPLRVTGWLINPGQDELDRGMLVTPDTLDLLRADCPADSKGFSCHLEVHGAGIVLREGAHRDAVVARLSAVAPGLVPVGPPSVVENLSEVGSTPWYLAGFLALIGGAGLAHALIVGVRRRRRDLAVARSLGLRTDQARWVVGWQALVMAVLGAAAGLAVGLLAARLIWQRVVHGVGALVEVRVPLVVVVAAPLCAIGLGLVLAAFTGRRASGLRPATVLRSE